MSFTRGMSRREISDIYRRIMVARQLYPTQAAMPPYGQVFSNSRTTTTALLSRATWVHCDRHPPSTFSLSGDYRQEFAPTSVQNRLAQSRFGK